MKSKSETTILQRKAERERVISVAVPDSYRKRYEALLKQADALGYEVRGPLSVRVEKFIDEYEAALKALGSNGRSHDIEQGRENSAGD
jgi:hypothetical protein